MSVVSISMPETLLDRIDDFADDHGYSGRSEVVREGTRTLLEEFQTPSPGKREQMCTVTVLFEYRHPAVQQRLTGVRHEYDATVTATTHAHVGDRYCLELFVLEGPTETMSGFVNAVRAVPDIRAVEYSMTSLGKELPDPSSQSGD
jgi:CopG family nickel-responsive transcriptional regulator